MSSLVAERPPGSEGLFSHAPPRSHPSGEAESWTVASSGGDTNGFPPNPWVWSSADLSTIQSLIGQMLGVARKILGDESQAWDAVQEALIALWSKGGQPTNLRAWLMSAVLFQSLHLARTRSRRRKHEQRACRRKHEATARDDPSLRIEHAELNQILEGAIQNLPPAYAEVFLMRTVAGLDYAEIAEFLNVPLGTVRSRLSRGRRLIEATLSGKLPPDGF